MPNGETPPGIGFGVELTCGLPSCAPSFVDKLVPTARKTALPKNCRRETPPPPEHVDRFDLAGHYVLSPDNFRLAQLSSPPCNGISQTLLDRYVRIPLHVISQPVHTWKNDRRVRMIVDVLDFEEFQDSFVASACVKVFFVIVELAGRTRWNGRGPATPDVK